MNLKTKNVQLKIDLGRTWCWLCVFLQSRPGREDRQWCSKHHENRHYEDEVCEEFKRNEFRPLSEDLHRR